MPEDALAVDLNHQLKESKRTREFAYSILVGEHKNNFERKDHIAFGFFNRCLQTHEATEILVRESLIDDAWVLVRTMVEHAVNCAYMFYVADVQTADDFADFPIYKRYQELQDLKLTNENLFRQIVSAGQEDKILKRFEAVRARFDGKRGDKWCVDDRLFKRASRVDEKISEAMKEKHNDFLWLVNSVWRYGSAYVHGTADALVDQMTETADGVSIQRKYTPEEGAQALHSANFALYLILLLVDLRLGAKAAEEIKRRFEEWGGTKRPS